MLNNGIYGMTGGQVAPTTPVSKRTQTSPFGNVEYPFDVCELAKAAGATYVARWTVAHPRPLLGTIREGMEHRGFAYIEVISQCPTQAGRYMEGTSNPGELLSLMKKRALPVDQARQMTPPEIEGRIIVGTLHHVQNKKELSQAIYENFPEE
jgi:2-oxoglutarate ferredoxin oxidoreductase subunit beta